MALLGVILDLSSSMRVNVEGKDDKNDQWLQSLFDAFNDLLEHNEISEDNKIFAIGIGVNKQLNRDTFDLLGTLENNVMTKDSKENLSHTQVIHEAMQILKKSGASLVDKWAPANKVRNVVSEEKAKIILNWLRADHQFCENVAKKLLPHPCRVKATKYVYSPFKSTATKEDIEKVVREMIMQKIPDTTQSSVKNLREASAILKGSMGIELNQPLTKERISEIKDIINPLIYGETPLITSLNQAINIFSATQYRKCQKFLVVLSDGNSTDGTTPPSRKLKELGVQTISCYVTQKHIDQPKQLFSTQCISWDSRTKFMFDLSSEKKTQEIPHTVFIKKGWKVDVGSNKTKLFAQINHPDLLRDVTDLVRNVITSKDALADVLSSVSLDCYINQKIKELESPLQSGGTCYANAAAAVFHLAMNRIVGRDHGYPEFEDLKNKMIEIYGDDGAITENVLEQMCPSYRLHVAKVNFKEALSAVAARRPVLATFYLEGKERDAFSAFFYFNPKGILTERDLQKKNFKGDQKSESGGHAVVFTSYNNESLVFMNSWGRGWGDNGFFSIADSKVLNCKFYDVYWTLNDLSDAEKSRFENHGRRLTENENTCRVMSIFKSKLKINNSCPKE